MYDALATCCVLIAVVTFVGGHPGVTLVALLIAVAAFYASLESVRKWREPSSGGVDDTHVRTNVRRSVKSKEEPLTGLDALVDFVLVAPRQGCRARDFEAIGDRLLDWMRAERATIAVRGLEQLLAGEHPTIPSVLLAIPIAFSSFDEQPTEPFALVAVDRAFANEATGNRLREFLDGQPCGLVDPDFYSYICR